MLLLPGIPQISHLVLIKSVKVSRLSVGDRGEALSPLPQTPDPGGGLSKQLILSKGLRILLASKIR